jgi:hypothetical protein
MIATNTDDDERATRINGYADALAAAAPVLVNAAKASLSNFGTPYSPLIYMLLTVTRRSTFEYRNAKSGLKGTVSVHLQGQLKLHTNSDA